MLNSFFEVCATITQNGEAINTDLFKTNFSITGTFAAATDHFDKAKQKLHLNLHSGKTLDEALAKVLLEKTSVSQQLPEILEVLDSTSGSVNDQITPGGAIKIAGSRLKVEGTEAGVGVFINSTDGVKVNKVATLIENKPSLLIVRCPPPSPQGQYNLIVSTQYGGRSGNLLNTPRSTTFNRTLTVA